MPGKPFVAEALGTNPCQDHLPKPSGCRAAAGALCCTDVQHVPVKGGSNRGILPTVLTSAVGGCSSCLPCDARSCASTLPYHNVEAQVVDSVGTSPCDLGFTVAHIIT